MSLALLLCRSGVLLTMAHSGAWDTGSALFFLAVLLVLLFLLLAGIVGMVGGIIHLMAPPMRTPNSTRLAICNLVVGGLGALLMAARIWKTDDQRAATWLQFLPALGLLTLGGILLRQPRAPIAPPDPELDETLQ